MPMRHANRYCADSEALMAMKRDGLGWGHDLDCGCFYEASRNTKPNSVARIVASFKRRT